MASNSETSHAKNIANLKSLHDSVVRFDPPYNPFDDDLKAEALDRLHQQIVLAQAELKTANEAWRRQAAARLDVFEPLNPLVTRALAIFEVSKAGQTIKDHVKTLADLIRGEEKTAPADPPAEGESPEEQRRSNSQQSYVKKADNFASFITALKAEPTYRPNADDIKVTALETLLASLVAANSPTDEALKAWKRKLAARDTLMYAPATGMVDISMKVKKAVKGEYGTDSIQYREIRSLRFTRKRN